MIHHHDRTHPPPGNVAQYVRDRFFFVVSQNDNRDDWLALFIRPARRNSATRLLSRRAFSGGNGAFHFRNPSSRPSFCGVLIRGHTFLQLPGQAHRSALASLKASTRLASGDRGQANEHLQKR